MCPPLVSRQFIKSDWTLRNNSENKLIYIKLDKSVMIQNKDEESEQDIVTGFHILYYLFIYYIYYYIWCLFVVSIILVCMSGIYIFYIY